MEVSTSSSQRTPRIIHSWESILHFCFQTNSVTSPGKSSRYGDFKTPTRIPALYLLLDIKGNPSKNPGMKLIRMPINSLPSRRASREKYHNTPSSRMRSILRLSKEIFWLQPQHMAVKKSWKETACLDIIMIVRNYLNKSNTSCTVFSTKCYKVTWANHSQEICTNFGCTITMEGI